MDITYCERSNGPSARRDMENKIPFEGGATARLARRLGVELEYVNAAGERVFTTPAIATAILAAMGYRVENELDAEELLRLINDDECSHLIPPVLVIRHDQQPVRIPLNLGTLNQSYTWRLICEDGELAEVGTLSAARLPELSNSLPLTVELPCGYHRFEIDNDSMSLIVAPPKCWLAPIEQGEKIWGIATQLYLLRSDHNWGIGDFTDLGTLIDIAAEWGVSVIGLNPLHSLFVDDPEQASPYAPASRLHLNILNIDVTAIPEFATCKDANTLLMSSDFASALAAVRRKDFVDYSAVADLKLRMLRVVYGHFKMNADDERRRSLAAFVRDRGESLNHFCKFQAIRLDRAGTLTTDDGSDLLEGLQNFDSPAIDEFVAQHRAEIDFLRWTQWIADAQLRDAASRAEAGGMTLGLYRDLAVGSSSAGAEAWSNPEIVAREVHAGVPPDILNPAGQDWGLPPFNPRALRESRYTPFIELVRANMRYCRALRIDHVVGLQHLYWVPAGNTPDQGSYVTYPFNDLIGILALESWRNRCLVIGEDLGTVPKGFSESLNERGILSYRVLYFEQDKSGQFKAPSEYQALALATVGSHDLATLRGWWLANDVAIREQHGLYPEPRQGHRQREIRDKEKRELLSVLRREGLDPGDGNDFYRLSLSVHAFLARSGAAIAMVQLEDLIGEILQTNLPATSKEHPNWRRRLSKSLEELGEDPNVAGVINAVRHERSHS
jgi:4-alpha-glucanotransferase